MFALISPNEKQGQYQRIAELAAEPFDVAEPLHWVAAPGRSKHRFSIHFSRIDFFESILVGSQYRDYPD